MFDGIAARRRSLDKRFGLPAALIFLFVILTGMLDCAGDWVEARLPGVEGLHAKAWLQTRELAPGDSIAVRVTSEAGYRSKIAAIHARIGSNRADLGGAQPVFNPDRSNRDEAALALVVPETIPLGAGRITIEVEMLVEDRHPLRGGQPHEWTDHLELPCEIRSPASCIAHRLGMWVLALAAWLATCALAFGAVRWGPGRAPIEIGGLVASRRSGRVLFGLVFVALVPVAMLGQLAFVRPILWTTSLQSGWLSTTLRGVWLAALVIGGWLGHRARRQAARWRIARLRAVLGTPRQGGYREPALMLPPSLSRDADRHGRDEIVRAIRAAGFEVSGKARRLGIAKMVAIRARRDAPWVPEDLRIQILDDFDARPLVQALTALYGPMELTPFGREPIIVE